ncbi:MAG: porphobilinogen synthase [Coriobacteriales bacterium]|jgi:porphobilinogen synthase|nr:porphobilinogen synthase [Coriobacteriales bacterium]
MDLVKRPRRLRTDERIRSLVREQRLTREQLVYPLFVREGNGAPTPVPSMPGICQYPLEHLTSALSEVVACAVPAVLFFGIPLHKDAMGTRAYAEDGIVQQALRVAKDRFPELYLIGDVCLCEYTDHGHCGLVSDGQVLNDESVELLARAAVAQAESGADMVAPSDMMDGRVGAIRRALDQAGFEQTPIMSYAAKFASAFYGPFRQAANSAPQFGDRLSYQLDPANGDEAMRDTALDVAEGADVILVKPAMAYGDIIYRTKQSYGLPVAAYNVSGEYAMVKAAAAAGWIDERRVVLEALLGMRRAGADILVTYHALDASCWLQEP